MKVRIVSKLYAGANSIFDSNVASGLVDQKVDGWIVLEADPTAPNEITLILEGDIDPEIAIPFF